MRQMGGFVSTRANDLPTLVLVQVYSPWHFLPRCHAQEGMSTKCRWRGNSESHSLVFWKPRPRAGRVPSLDLIMGKEERDGGDGWFLRNSCLKAQDV